MTHGIFWLASYPKSGNTWLRVLLANYDAGTAAPVDINGIGGIIASHRHLFDEHVGVEASELAPDEIAALRPCAYRVMASDAARAIYVKVHDAYRRPGAEPVIPGDVTAGVVYLMRNPLDIAVSLAHHRGTTLDAAVEALCDGLTLSPSGDRLSEQLEQVLLSWSGHVASWLESPLPLLAIRYEDLLRDPQACLSDVLRFVGIDPDPALVDRAVTFSSFAELRRQEQSNGFRERAPRASAFFRTGRSGDGLSVLSPAQVDRIISVHGGLMRRFGYVDDANGAIGHG